MKHKKKHYDLKVMKFESEVIKSNKIEVKVLNFKSREVQVKVIKLNNIVY